MNRSVPCRFCPSPALQLGLAMALAVFQGSALRAEELGTTNRDCLTHFRAAAAELQRPVTVVSFGDSMADSYRSAAWALMKVLVERLGVAGYALNNYANAAMCRLTNGAAVVPPSEVWFTAHYQLPVGAGVWWEKQWSPGGVDCDGVGVFWVSQPQGGPFTLSVSTNGGPWTVRLNLEGASPAPAGHFTNVALPRNLYRVRVDSLAGTNYVVGPQLLLAHTAGVHVVFIDQGGISLGEVTNVPAAVREPILAALRPDLLVWHMKEDGSAATSNRMVECERWWSQAAPDCDVVYIGTPWVGADAKAPYTLSQNRIVRAIAVNHHRAYIDLMQPSMSYQWLLKRGFMSDETHLNASGGVWLAKIMWDDLGFDSLPRRKPAP